jgi:Leucine-rich repeat (LRR) protein
LDVSYNKLTSLPYALYEMRQLMHLNARNNKIDSLPPLPALKKVVVGVCFVLSIVLT